MDFQQMFINSLWVLGIVVVCTFSYTFIAGLFMSMKSNKLKKKMCKTLLDELNKANKNN